jgi:heme-degrading monooxygenase HmoA
MVIRVLTGRIRPGREGELGPAARNALPELRAREGLIAAHFGRQAQNESSEFVLVTVWRSIEDLYAWVGPHLDRPKLLAGHEDLLIDYDLPEA